MKNEQKSTSKTPDTGDAFADVFNEMQEDYTPAPEEVLDYAIKSAYHIIDLSEKDVFNTVWENKPDFVRYICAAFGALVQIETPEEKTVKIFDETVGKAMRGETQFEEEFEIVKGEEQKFVIIKPKMRGCIDYAGYSIQQIEENQFNVYKHGSYVDKEVAFCGSGNSVEACIGMLHYHWIKDDEPKFVETSLKKAAAVERAVSLSDQMVKNELDPKRPKTMLVDDESEQEIPADDEGFSDHQEGEEEEM